MQIPGTGRRDTVALSADEVADLNTTAARLRVHGKRYNDIHISLVGR